MIRQPTGRNGYEELLQASDLLRTSKLLGKAQDTNASLSIKRQALAEKPVMDALRLTRQGLAKPVFPPRQEITPYTNFPEFAGFRNIGRVLRIQQYVLLADGRTTEALGVLRLGLRLGRVLQAQTLISGLVGIAVDAITVNTLGGHLDQLSARDCELLLQVCLERLREPDPYPEILEGEQRLAWATLAEARKAAAKDGLGTLLDSDADEEDTEKETPEPKPQVPLTPQELEALWKEVERRVDDAFARARVEVRKPLWERALAKADEDESLAEQLADMFAPIFTQAGHAYARNQAQLRLLACHAAIRRYRWEHDRLPPTLAVLDLGDLAVDPFTGEPLQYEVTGVQYRLHSVGAPASPEDEKAVDGRRPVSVVP
ncbi:MAG TPA: hypothetical protein VK689_18955, partial [Armatimonadota bacterium]|nr:hypothetical protein [Armatimonadota bacterium]